MSGQGNNFHRFCKTVPPSLNLTFTNGKRQTHEKVKRTEPRVQSLHADSTVINSRCPFLGVQGLWPNFAMIFK